MSQSRSYAFIKLRRLRLCGLPLMTLTGLGVLYFVSIWIPMQDGRLSQGAARWKGHLGELDPIELQLAFVILDGPIWKWIQSFPKTAPVRAHQVADPFLILSQEISALPSDAGKQPKVQGFVARISKVPLA